MQPTDTIRASPSTSRPGLVEDAGFPPELAPWARLRTVRAQIEWTVGAFANPSVPIDEMTPWPSL